MSPRPHLGRPLPQCKTFLIGLASKLEFEDIVIRQPQLHQRARRALIIFLLLKISQRFLIVFDGRRVGILLPGGLAGQQVIFERLVPITRLLVMVGQPLGHAFFPAPVLSLQCFGYAAVQQLAP